MYDAIDLFAGPGGWDVAAHRLGLNVLGIEWDHAACETRRTAGLPTIEGDVRAYGPADFPARGFIASPPCQTFSMAGGGAGRRSLDVVLDGIKRLKARESVSAAEFSDERTSLVLEPLRWMLAAIDAGMPYEWAAFEQVPTVLPVWEAMADVLRREGYGVAVGKLSAEQYGVPQTRKRAILVARLDGEAHLPAPTHRPYKKGTAQADGDPALLPWVSMAEALGWGMNARPALTVSVGTEAGGADTSCVGGSGARASLYRERDEGRWVQQSNYSAPGLPGQTAAERGLAERPVEEPSFAVTSKASRWLHSSAQQNATVRAESEPAPTITGGHDHGERRWVYRSSNQENSAKRPLPDPAPTVNFGARSNKVEWMPEETAADPRASGVRVTPAEAALLQSFPADHPWQGTKTKVFQQIGNAVPPLLAEAVLRAVSKPA